MKNFINGGVHDREGHRIPTKRRLKELIKADPYLVEFYRTSTLGDDFSGGLHRLRPGQILVVTGPDPYTDRRWHAIIERLPTERMRVT